MGTGTMEPGLGLSVGLVCNGLYGYCPMMGRCPTVYD